MYYSKNVTTEKISVPKNYSGNTFRQEATTDESTYPQSETSTIIEKSIEPFDTENSEINNQKTQNNMVQLPSFLQNISVEDILLLGLIFVIHQENPNDSTLVLLLILLLAK